MLSASYLTASFPRKRESIASDSEHMTYTFDASASAASDTSYALQTRRRWIPAFAGMALVFLLTLFLSFPAVAAPKSASDVIKNFYAQLVDVMKQGQQLGFSGRYKKLDPAVEQAYNMPLMTKLAVGLGWNNATPAEQQQLTKAFTQFSVANYASRFTAYNGEQFSVTGEDQTDGGKIVRTTLKPQTADAVALNYLMKQDDTGNWRIVDVFINGTISELATRRAEFSSVIQNDGIDALVNSLDNKSKAMGPT